MVKKNKIFFLLVLSFSEFVWGEGPTIYQKQWEKKFIESNILISEWFDGVAEGLDLFLVGKKMTNRKNETNVKIENSTFNREGEPSENSTSVGINLRLPNLEEYWQLKFTSYDEQQERRTVRNNYARQTARQNNYGATVGFFRKLGNFRAAFQPRIELRNPLIVSHSMILESVSTVRNLEINPKLELYANAAKGVGIFQALNFNLQLTPIFSLTMINEGDYEEKPHKFSETNGFTLGQVIDDISTISYSIMLVSTNRPTYILEGYTLSVTWDHLIYKKILDYQITPYLDFPSTAEYRGSPGLTFVVSLNF